MRLAAVLWSVLLATFHLGANSTMVYGVGVFVICLGLGEIVHRYVEKPMARAILKGMGRSPPFRRSTAPAAGLG